jgi:hypothetical protein
MIEFSNYNDAIDFWNGENSKIKCVIFYKHDCPYCDDFIPHVLEPALVAKEDHFDVRKICVETSGLPFPPVSTPVVYFNIPNTTEPMPLTRTSGATPEILENDLNAMISMKDEGKTIQQAFFEGKTPPMSAWTQFFTRIVR